MKKKSTDILDKLVSYIFLKYRDTKCRYPNPGDLVKKLSPEERKVLENLKSDDIKNIRDDYIKLWIEE